MVKISNGYGFDRWHGVNDTSLRIRSLNTNTWNSVQDIVFNRQETAGRLYHIVCLIWTHVVGNTFIVLLVYYLNWNLGTRGDKNLKYFLRFVCLKDARLSESERQKYNRLISIKFIR